MNPQMIFKSCYWIAGILAVLSIFGAVPSWVAVVIGVVGFVLHWQYRAHNQAEAKKALDALYRRYAPELTQNYASDQKYLEDKITLLRETEPDVSAGFADIFDAYIAKWEAIYKEPMPHYITYAILRDFEYIQKFMGMKNTRAVATSRALIDRFDDFDHWLEITGTPITDEEVEAAERILEENSKSKKED